MADILLDGTPIQTVGDLPEVGTKAADFSFTRTSLADEKLSDYAGKNVVLNIFPSINTGICQASARKFNEELSSMENTVVICLSKDLPFAHSAFCEAEGLKDIIPASEYKNNSFSDAYPVKIAGGAFEGLFSRAIIVIGTDGVIKYTEQVPDIAQEPDYAKAIASI